MATTPYPRLPPGRRQDAAVERRDRTIVRARRLGSIEIDSVETLVPHGLGQTPSDYNVVPLDLAAVIWYESRPPDDRYLYLINDDGPVAHRITVYVWDEDI